MQTSRGGRYDRSRRITFARKYIILYWPYRLLDTRVLILQDATKQRGFSADWYSIIIF